MRRVNASHCDRQLDGGLFDDHLAEIPPGARRMEGKTGNDLKNKGQRSKASLASHK